MEFLLGYYTTIKALHIIAVVAWMAGMLYLPRLYVYHADAAAGSELSETLKIMERRLLRIILNPAMIATWILGALMIMAHPELLQQGWVHVKLTCLVLMQVVHAFYARWRKVFMRDENDRPAKFYRLWNEAPTVLMIIIVFMAVLKPF